MNQGVSHHRQAVPALRIRRVWIALILGMVTWFVGMPLCCQSATFSGNASVSISDPTGALSWNGSGLTISCWVKLAVPSETVITENMTVLVNRVDGSDADLQAYQLRFNIASGNLEFFTRGSLDTFVKSLIDRPYLERWYHLAVVRQSDEFTGYVDGRQVFRIVKSVGNSSNGSGVSVGGWNGKFLFGEVQEVAVFQEALSQDFIIQNMFQEQSPLPTLKGYFKLAYSTNSADQLKNFAPTPVPSETDPGLATGPVLFEETNQGGEQSAFDSKKNGGKDALTPLSGAFAWQQTALARPTPGIAFEFRIGYSSGNAFGGAQLGTSDPYAAGVLGSGWRHSFEGRLIPGQVFSPIGGVDVLGLMDWDGAIETWDYDAQSDAYKTRSKEYRGELRLVGNTACEWTTPERLVYRYRHPFAGSLIMRGRLTEIRDFNTNLVQMLYNESTGVITQVVDSVRGRYDFTYTNNLLRSVQFQNWIVNFNFDASPRLISKTLTNTSGLYTNLNTGWQFGYNGTNGLLEVIKDPLGNTNRFVQYDRYGRRTNEVDAIGRRTFTEFGVPGKRQIRRLDPADFIWVETYDRKGRVTAQRDPLGNETKHAYDDAGNRIVITDPLGNKTCFGYDSRANVVTRTNALNEVTRWTFHSFFNKPVEEIDPLGWTNHYDLDTGTGNLLRHFDDLGTLVAYTYTTNGLVTSSLDGNTNLTRFAYDTNGFLGARVDAAGFTNSCACNEVGWKLAETNAFGHVTTFAYDLNGNTVRTVDALQRVFVNVFDPNANLTTNFDAKGQFTTHQYDAANQRTNTTDRTRTNIWTYLHTSRGKLNRTIDPLTNQTVNLYDAANLLVNVSDALGNSVTNIYDGAGNLTDVIDLENRRWHKTYDHLNRLIADIDPEQNSSQTTYDPAGRIKQITSPNGFPSSHEYDGRGRLKRWTHAEGFNWRYTYDGNGNITDIEDALHGHYVMTYGPRNERTLERNQDGKEWLYTYDALLRLQSQRDPNGTVRTVAYDLGSRIESIAFSTGRINALGYDANNNPTVLSRTGAGPATVSQLTYDPMDRVAEYTDAFSMKVQYGYDSLGRVASLIYPDGKLLLNAFDCVGRLTNQVFNAQFTNSYAYDRVGRLARRVYPNGVVQTNTFDSAGHLTSLSYQTNGNAMIALTYAYDRNGNKVAGTEKGTLDWPLPSFADETTSFTPAGRMIDRQVQQSSAAGVTTNNFALAYQYDASGNMTNASGGGQTWRLNYDEDNRVTEIGWDCGLTARQIINRYDALGRRVARTVDGNETHNVLDLAGSMERVLCDTDEAGVIRAWYVHGPDLSFMVDAADNLTCYHADAHANVIATTDNGRATTHQYAYTPYGRSLGTANIQFLASNPYNFVGSQGVMEELPGLYFMRARYYLVDSGIFLSTDSIKNIGPNWKPTDYIYANSNPVRYNDPGGKMWGEAFVAAGFAYDVANSIYTAVRYGDTTAAEDLITLSYLEDEAQNILAASEPTLGSAISSSIIIANWVEQSGEGLIAASYGNKNYKHSLLADITYSAVWTSSHRGPAGPNANSTAMYITDPESQPLKTGSAPPSFSVTPKRKSVATTTAFIAAPKAMETAHTSATTPAGPATNRKASNSQKTYTVKPGDTLGNIGYANGTTAGAIAAANGIQKPNLIRPGQLLTIPR